MASSSTSNGSVTSSPNPQPEAPTAAVQPTTLSKTITPEPDFNLSSNSRDTASHLGSGIDTNKLNQDDFQAWIAVDLEHQKSCNLAGVLEYILSFPAPDGIVIDHDLPLDKCLKGVLPIRHLEVITNCIKRRCAEAANKRDRYAPNDHKPDNVAVWVVGGVHYEMPPIIGLSWRDDIERTGTLSFTEIDPCHTDFWTGLITSPYRHELEGEIWVLPWTHLQCDEKNLIKSHPKLLSWTGALEAASNAKIAMYWKWHELVPYACWKSEWDLAFALCHMLHRAAAARAEIELAHWRRPDRCPKLADVEKTTGQVYDEFWAVVKQFYADEEDLDCYRVLRRELCLPVDA